MSSSTFVTRIEDALAGNDVRNCQRGRNGGYTSVRSSDLRDLLHHFKRLDAEVRARYHQDLINSEKDNEHSRPL